MFAVELINITKKFGDFFANDNISFNILDNSVHCIIGENGAGKSTLMKIIFGAYHLDSGHFKIYEEPKKFKTSHEAIASKIGMLFQHFMLIDDFTVLENVILGNEITKGIKLDFPVIRKKLTEFIDFYNLGLDLDKKISELSVSEQQKVEILKLLYRNSSIIIFDEPTAVLSPYEVKKFFEIILKFKAEEKTIIFITHKLNEVQEIADFVTVLRKGKVVYEEKKENISISNLSKAMVGDVILKDIEGERSVNKTDKIAIDIKNIVLEKNEAKVLNGVNLNLRYGEIHGIAGVEGNGQGELIDVLCGLEKKYSGEYISESLKIGVVPDDRIKKGMIKEFNIGENLILKNYDNFFINNKIIGEKSTDIISKYDVKLSENNSPLQSLSGGNQQKVIFAREIESNSNFLIFYHPTRGVDINSTNFIHYKILEERNSGKAILLVSSDLDELISLSDTLSVIYKGRILKIFEDVQSLILNDIDKNKLIESIGKLMLGIE